jgi:hypothetical protein
MPLKYLGLCAEARSLSGRTLTPNLEGDREKIGMKIEAGRLHERKKTSTRPVSTGRISRKPFDALPDVQDRMAEHVPGAKHADQHNS